MTSNLADGMLRACDYPRLTGPSLDVLKRRARETLFMKTATKTTRQAHFAYHDGVILREVEGLLQKISPTSAYVTLRTAKVPATTTKEAIPAQTFDIPLDYVVAYGFGQSCSSGMRAMLKAQYKP